MAGYKQPAGSFAGSDGPGVPRKLPRRGLLFGGAAAGLGALTAAGAQLAGAGVQRAATTAPVDSAESVHGSGVIPFHGDRQAGITTAAQAHGVFVALDLRPGTTRADVRSLLRLLSDDAADLCAGRPALADTEGDLARVPARLTVTFGVGPGLVAAVDPAQAPEWLKPLPAFSIDRLQPGFSDGDLLLQVCADDPLTVAHAQRMLLKDSRSFATVRWVQAGFRRSYGSEKSGTTMRNLFGQVDGTANPAPDSTDYEQVVWGGGDIPSWIKNGTSVVVRRIAMNLDKWDEADRIGREESVGRRLSNGAPLTGTHEHDEPDFAAVSKLGFPVISEVSHLRRARPADGSQRIFRRAYNYDAAPGAGGVSDSGLIFVSYQADVDKQFTPIQRRLDQMDMLNQWTTPVGSAVFAIPPGCRDGGFVGDVLFA
ncbi:MULTISPECIES: Dyp-type peroxidase [unclassified Arthrobacter]|uniref:Dyp-type peroxidase n=1 Tax=unclassified Arthrobacter TaxID=235627 RepID=UPI002DFBA689|nr:MULTISPECIES: Dyp-type peroxidase [unclassified Arthrobacter]MEC5193359.1 dye decolorizing peroxidase [Arthrobacter sp. MP_M4]MEC5204825.1 dye decolorizing peroxidase [Arthrobacter sp. MP_M7]